MSKKALLVGINEFIPSINPLHGCINDTIMMQGLLKETFGFQDDEIRVLNDAQATNKAIRDNLNWLLSEYEGGGHDVRVFHFSSHGTQVDDQTGGEEWDCLDEVIVPYDHDWNNPFRDDDLRQIFDPIPEEVNFAFIADCCHSGSIQKGMFDAKIDFSPRFLLPPDEILDRIAEKIKQRDQDANAWMATQLTEQLQGIPQDRWAEKIKSALNTLTKRYKQNNFAVVKADRHVLMAACEDRQTAADAVIDGDFRGAFTWALGMAIKENNGKLSYDDLVKAAASHLTKYGQHPQLECPTAIRNRQVFAPYN